MGIYSLARQFSTSIPKMAPPRLNHTMFRIKDAKVSLKFYTEILGMELVHKSDGGDFTNYFLAFPEEGKEHLSAEEKADRKFMLEGILELCHNWGTESDPEFKKRPQDGKMKHIAFIYDPDRYWIEIVPNGG